MVAVAMAAVAVGAAISVPASRTSAQAPAASGTAPKTAWGEPDLQGIWTDEFDTALQRPAEYAGQEFFTPAQREEIDKQRRAHFGSDPRQQRGSAIDVGGAYNTVFLTVKHVGARTSLIVDPPDGRIPPQTPAAQQAAAADRAFRLALLQSTDACRNKAPSCAGGKYDPTPSPRFAEIPPRYHAGNFERFNRGDGPEDDALADRCLHSGLPDFGSLFGGSYRRIVQTPGGIAMFYDLNQGQGWQRNIVMNGSPHLPAGIRQWFGDSRGRWEGDTLVVETTNLNTKGHVYSLGGGFRYSPKTRITERFTRTAKDQILYEFSVEDPEIFTKPWRAEMPMRTAKGPIYEYACHEGNYSLPNILAGARVEESERAAAPPVPIGEAK
jgi:hypothetical protein